jgi:putative toxin-antitoxin system antitoxin component (TIGR02293 family)
MKATAKKMVAVFKGDTYEVISKMRSGTPARTVAAIAANLGLSPDTLFDLLRLPKSTLKGRISSGGKLSAPEQDRMYRADKVLSRAVQVLEDEKSAKAWLSRSNRSLGGEMPLALLDTEVGFELVLDTLEGIKFGVIP